MNFLRELIVNFLAKRDAVLGVDASTRRVVARHGPNPIELHRDTLPYRQALRDAANDHEIEDLAEEQRQAEERRVTVGAAWPYTVGFVIITAVEFFGANLIMRSLGLEPVDRLLPALALALALIGITKVTAKLAQAHTSPTNTSWATKLRRLAARIFIPALYTLFVLSIAIVRIAGADAEDTLPLVAWAESAVMLAVSVGPAWVAAWLEEHRAPAAELARQLRVVGRRLAEARTRQTRALRYLNRLDADVVRWRARAEREGAAYSTAHERARAEEQTHTTPSRKP